MAKSLAALGIALVVVPLIFFGGVFALNSTISESEDVVTTTNESFTPTGGDVTVFDNSGLDFANYNDTVTVRNASTGTVFANAGNYTYFDANGTLEPVANSDLANASSATVTYSYVGLERGQTAIASLTTQITPFLAEIVLVFGAILLLAGLILFGGAA